MKIDVPTFEEQVWKSYVSDDFSLQQNLTDDIINASDNYILLQSIALWTILLFFLRLCCYVRYEGKIALITKMLLLSSYNLLHFILFFIVFLGAFSLSAMSAYSGVSPRFRTFVDSFKTTFDLAFANERFDHELLFQVCENKARFLFCCLHDLTLVALQLKPLLTEVYSICFAILAGLVLLNVFIAILMDAYSEVVSDPSNSYTLVEEIREGCHRRFTAQGPFTDLPDVEELLRALQEQSWKTYYSYDQLVHLVGQPLQWRTDELIRSLGGNALSCLSHQEVVEHYESQTWEDDTESGLENVKFSITQMTMVLKLQARASPKSNPNLNPTNLCSSSHCSKS